MFGMDVKTEAVLAGTLVAALIAAVVASIKIVLDYRFSTRRLQIDEVANRDRLILDRQRLAADEVVNITGAVTQVTGAFVSCLPLVSDRLGNLLSRPDERRAWIGGCHGEPEYYQLSLLERLIRFLALGKRAEDAVNGLPKEIREAHPEMQLCHGVARLGRATLSDTHLFMRMPAGRYDDRTQRFHLFVGTVHAIAENGLEGNRIALNWQQEPGLSLREFICSARTNSDDLEAASFVISRLAVLRAVVNSFLFEQRDLYDAPPREKSAADLMRDLAYASAVGGSANTFQDLVPDNLSWMMDHFRCDRLKLGG